MEGFTSILLEILHLLKKRISLSDGKMKLEDECDDQDTDFV